eukprot:1202477-Pyramimonas_sp.AAC.1
MFACSEEKNARAASLPLGRPARTHVHLVLRQAPITRLSRRKTNTKITHYPGKATSQRCVGANLEAFL